MNFNSQICTTKEQSERLVSLDLKKETADMSISTSSLDTDNGIKYSLTPFAECKFRIMYNVIPAWSLHRLIEIMPQWIHTIDGSFKLTIDQGKLVCYREISDEVQTFVFGHTSLYDSIIDIIEKLIKEGHFNKEYLEE